jgi:glycosyltransferase involved in cell wall biosynthesis
MSVRLQLIDHLIAEERKRINQHKIYTLWDAYPHANMVTYPSLYEGFGNALLETIYFKRPAVINKYPVYNADIRPKGFNFIELDGFVDDRAVDKTAELLQSPDIVEDMVETNYKIAREHFSFEVLENKLTEVLKNF